jgi:hypothetical protein
MYNPDGIYRYFHGWNWRAWLVFSIAVGPILPGFAQSINPELSISPGAEHLYTFSWMWGFVTCTILYYVVCKYISPPTESFVDVAVFPPRTVEEEEARVLMAQQQDSPDSDSVEKIGVNVDSKLSDKV